MLIVERIYTEIKDVEFTETKKSTKLLTTETELWDFSHLLQKPLFNISALWLAQKIMNSMTNSLFRLSSFKCYPKNEFPLVIWREWNCIKPNYIVQLDDILELNDGDDIVYSKLTLMAINGKDDLFISLGIMGGQKLFAFRFTYLTLTFNLSDGLPKGCR